MFGVSARKYGGIDTVRSLHKTYETAVIAFNQLPSDCHFQRIFYCPIVCDGKNIGENNDPELPEGVTWNQKTGTIDNQTLRKKIKLDTDDPGYISWKDPERFDLKRFTVEEYERAITERENYYKDFGGFRNENGKSDDDLEDGEKIIVGAAYSEVLGVFNKMGEYKRISLSHWSGPYKHPSCYKRLYPKGDPRGLVKSNDETSDNVDN